MVVPHQIGCGGVRVNEAKGGVFRRNLEVEEDDARGDSVH
jgi:hypothetical protein